MSKTIAHTSVVKMIMTLKHEVKEGTKWTRNY